MVKKRKKKEKMQKVEDKNIKTSLFIKIIKK